MSLINKILNEIIEENSFDPIRTVKGFKVKTYSTDFDMLVEFVVKKMSKTKSGSTKVFKQLNTILRRDFTNLNTLSSKMSAIRTKFAIDSVPYRSAIHMVLTNAEKKKIEGDKLKARQAKPVTELKSSDLETKVALLRNNSAWHAKVALVIISTGLRSIGAMSGEVKFEESKKAGHVFQIGRLKTRSGILDTDYKFEKPLLFIDFIELQAALVIIKARIDGQTMPDDPKLRRRKIAALNNRSVNKTVKKLFSETSHKLRAVYGEAAFKKYGGVMNRSQYVGLILNHASDTASVAYTTVKLK